jgi:hypothetical protein
MLKWNVQIAADPFAIADDTEEVVVQIIGISIKQADPTDVWDLVKLPQQTVKRGPVLAIASVCSEILGDEIDFPDSSLHQNFGFLNNRVDGAVRGAAG